MIQAEVPTNSVVGPKVPPSTSTAGAAAGDEQNSTNATASTPTKKKQPPAISTDMNDQSASGSAQLASATSAGTDTSRSDFRQDQTPKHCNRAAGGNGKIGGGGATGASGVRGARNAPALGEPKTASVSDSWQAPRNNVFAPHPHFQGQPPPHPGRPGGPPGHPGGYYGPPPTRSGQIPFPPTGQPPYGPGGPPPPHHMHPSLLKPGQHGGAPQSPNRRYNGPPPPGGVYGSPGGTRQQHQQQPYMGYNNGPPQTVSPGSFRGGPPPVPHHHMDGAGIPGSASWEQQHHHHQQIGGYPPRGPSGYPPMASYHGMPHAEHPMQEGSASFSRTISSSFENVKSKGSDDAGSGDGKGGSNNSKKPASLSHDLHAYNSAQQRNQSGLDNANNDEASAGAASDHSWGMLHQVQSVDEAQMKAANEAKKLDKAKKAAEENRRREKKTGQKKRDPTETPTEQIEKGHAAEALSSLSNSPSQPKEQYIIPPADKVYPPLPTPSKLANLDSLSSVASVQEPLDTSGAEAPDLLQCGTGSSGSLLFPMATSSRHVRGNSLDHPIAPHDLIGAGSKRGREDREDEEAERCGLDDIRKAASAVSDDVTDDDDKDRPKKKKSKADAIAKTDTKKDCMDSKKKKNERQLERQKSSPLSIACTPPVSPGPKKLPPAATLSSTPGKPKLSELTASPGIPHYSFSIDSMPSFSKEAGRLGAYGVGLPPRPSSVSSGSIGGIGLPSHPNPGPDDIPHSMPSWEINGQDSFHGGMSIGSGGSGGQGQGLFSSFSFSNDYHMLTQNGGYPIGPGPVQGAQEKATNEPQTDVNETKTGDTKKTKKQGRSTKHQQPPIDSRNQSFDHGSQQRGQGGHLSRSGTFETAYTMSSIPAVPSWGSAGGQRFMQSPGGTQYPPQAHSWSSAGPGIRPQYGPSSYPPRGPMYSPHQMPMSRTYTEDSMKSSPGYHKAGVPNAFLPPPPDFGLPSQGQIGKRPPPAVYIMPTAPGSAPSGPGARPMTNSRSAYSGAAAKKRASGSGGAVFNWSKDDDSRLSEIMKKYKTPRDWEPIAREHARGKTAKECHERWIRYLKPGVRKGQWTDHEDAIVVEAVTTSNEQPFTRWSDLASRLPGRVGKQIRDRWVNHLNPNINHMPFSRDDDLLLWNGHKKYGKRWVEISTQCFNSSRSENHIKNRWYSASFKKFIANEFGPDAYAATVGPAKGKSPKGKGKVKA